MFSGFPAGSMEGSPNFYTRSLIIPSSIVTS